MLVGSTSSLLSLRYGLPLILLPRRACPRRLLALVRFRNLGRAQVQIDQLEETRSGVCFVVRTVGGATSASDGRALGFRLREGKRLWGGAGWRSIAAEGLIGAIALYLSF